MGGSEEWDDAFAQTIEEDCGAGVCIAACLLRMHRFLQLHVIMFRTVIMFCVSACSPKMLFLCK